MIRIGSYCRKSTPLLAVAVLIFLNTFWPIWIGFDLFSIHFNSFWVNFRLIRIIELNWIELYLYLQISTLLLAVAVLIFPNTFQLFWIEMNADLNWFCIGENQHRYWQWRCRYFRILFRCIWIILNWNECISSHFESFQIDLNWFCIGENQHRYWQWRCRFFRILFQMDLNYFELKWMHFKSFWVISDWFELVLYRRKSTPLLAVAVSIFPDTFSDGFELFWIEMNAFQVILSHFRLIWIGFVSAKINTATGSGGVDFSGYFSDGFELVLTKSIYFDPFCFLSRDFCKINTATGSGGVDFTSIFRKNAQIRLYDLSEVFSD